MAASPNHQFSKLAAWIAVAILFATLSAWVLIPPFPPPATMMDDTYTTLTENLGPPTGSIPTKFVVWERSRVIAVWSLEAGLSSALMDPYEHPGHVVRCLWIPWAGISMFCSRASRANPPS
jgi:hypothetical protein